ncbi:hypothetical protein NDU88_003037 [Pleurodeles waltl]|uniref:Uncharacterized protein n=1 Tax=Pleurodeles waltl TaxID=8319 RepID=A0AAV7LE45_PLEWA|nr:hypothetical protein NDU88_003037 [Pleurodeles waltl]
MASGRAKTVMAQSWKAQLISNEKPPLCCNSTAPSEKAVKNIDNTKEAAGQMGDEMEKQGELGEIMKTARATAAKFGKKWLLRHLLTEKAQVNRAIYRHQATTETSSRDADQRGTQQRTGGKRSAKEKTEESEKGIKEKSR